MSHIFRLLRCNQLSKARLPWMSHTPGLMPLNVNRAYQQVRQTQTSPKTDNHQEEQKERKEFQDNLEYTIRFKNLEIKKVFKEFYSLYGPLFIGCHIGISLTSLGFFCSLVWLTVDPAQYIPEFMAERIGETMTHMTGSGGKFVIAYAVHKLILPLRLGSAIWLTRLVASKIKLRKGVKSEKTS